MEDTARIRIAGAVRTGIVPPSADLDGHAPKVYVRQGNGAP
jgi:hypothetical protein